MPIIVLALLEANENSADLVRSHLQDQVAPTRAEKGCIQYDLHVSDTEPTKFMFYEIWESKNALQAHSVSPHILATRSQSSRRLAQPAGITSWELL